MADFETTTDIDDCRVWASGIMRIGDYDNFYCYNNIDAFMNFCKQHAPCKIYFHNLKFDGEFIICWLFNNGFKHENERFPKYYKTFTSLISDKGQFYSITVKFGSKQTVTIYDSLKVLPFKVEKIAEDFNLPIQKLEIDYDEKRDIGHILTNEEKDYLRNDVEIVGRAIEMLHKQGLTAMTTAGNAMKSYKEGIGKSKFLKLFPPPYYDSDVRLAYKGGFTWLNPRFKEVDIGEGIVLDVNSLYPSRMYYEMLPYGEGKFFNGEYKYDEKYPLYIQTFSCKFDLKKDHIPTIQLKNSVGFNPVEYISSSDGQQIMLTLTNVDFNLFRKHYKVKNLEFVGGWKFRGGTGLFKDYIDHWNAVKVQATIDKNSSMRTIAKLMLNSLYGKFATSPSVASKSPFMEEGAIRYKTEEEEDREPIYVPVAAFITAYARSYTISAAQKVFDRFIYADTDSLHLVGTEIPPELEISDTTLGAWKHESTFSRARFIRSKTYIEEIDGELKVTCAGLPDRVHPYVTWENFHSGTVYGGAYTEDCKLYVPCKHSKLRHVHTKGGVVLVPTSFKIKG